MALIDELRTYFAAAFTGKYFEQAETAFTALKTMVADPTSKFIKTTVPFPRDDGESDEELPGLMVGNVTFAQQFPKLHIVFMDRRLLNKERGAEAALLDYYRQLFWIFKDTNAYVLLIGVTTGGAPLTRQLVQSQMKSSRVLKHLFVHEFVHYVQQNRFAAILLPLAYGSKDTPYKDQWEEIEAWNVESFSRFLSKVPRTVKLEIINDITRFEIAFMRFIIDHHQKGASFFLRMTEIERGRFIRESFDLLRKKMTATTKGT